MGPALLVRLIGRSRGARLDRQNQLCNRTVSWRTDRLRLPLTRSRCISVSQSRHRRPRSTTGSRPARLAPISISTNATITVSSAPWCRGSALMSSKSVGSGTPTRRHQAVDVNEERNFCLVASMLESPAYDRDGGVARDLTGHYVPGRPEPSGLPWNNSKSFVRMPSKGRAAGSANLY